MTNIIEWLKQKRAAFKERKACSKREKLERMSCEIINVVEFDGKLYISHHNVPVVPVDALNTEVEKVVAVSRKGYLSWKTKFAS